MALTRSARPGALSAEQAWAAIAAFVLYHELSCDKGQLLSEGYDRGLAWNPAVVYGVTAITVGHLLNWLPPKADPYRWIYLVHRSITKGSK